MICWFVSTLQNAELFKSCVRVVVDYLEQFVFIPLRGCWTKASINWDIRSCVCTLRKPCTPMREKYMISSNFCFFLGWTVTLPSSYALFALTEIQRQLQANNNPWAPPGESSGKGPKSDSSSLCLLWDCYYYYLHFCSAFQDIQSAYSERGALTNHHQRVVPTWLHVSNTILTYTHWNVLHYRWTHSGWQGIPR